MADQQASMATTTLTGGCLCKQFRFRVELEAGQKLRGCHCHCQMCRQVSGASFWTNITIPRKSFHVDKGEMQIYKSSDFAERGFCATCGSTLTFAYLGDEEEIDVGIGNFDDPHAPAIQPDCHMWVENGLLPYDLTLPQYLTNSKGPRAN